MNSSVRKPSKVRAANFIALFAFACVLALASTANGAIRTVTNLNDTGPGSLRETIVTANPGDTIRFSVTGTITVTAGDMDIHKNLIIEGPGSPFVPFP